MDYEERITEEKKLPGNLTKADLLQNVSTSTEDVLAVGLESFIDHSNYIFVCISSYEFFSFLSSDPLNGQTSLLFDEEGEGEEAKPQEYADEEDEPIYVGPTPDKKIPAAKRRRRQQMEEERRAAERRREERRQLADANA